MKICLFQTLESVPIKLIRFTTSYWGPVLRIFIQKIFVILDHGFE